MTMQMKQAPQVASATLIAPDRMTPPLAPLAMPKQVLTPPPGLLRRALAQVQARLTPGRQSLRRTS